MAAVGRIERIESSLFQLLLQQITVILEVPKTKFKIHLTFSYKNSNFWYFSCICEVKNKVVQDLSRTFFYSRNKKLLLNHIQPMLYSYTPRKHWKTSDVPIF